MTSIFAEGHASDLDRTMLGCVAALMDARFEDLDALLWDAIEEHGGYDVACSLLAFVAGYMHGAADISNALLTDGAGFDARGMVDRLARLMAGEASHPSNGLGGPS